MRAKTIKAVLAKKFKEFTDSIEDDAVRKAVRDDAIITGGAITSLLMGEKPNDYDIYFKTRSTVLKVANYYVDKWKVNPPAKFKDHPEKLVAIRVDDTDPDRVRVVVKSAGIASESGADDYQYFEQADPADAEQFVDAVIPAAEESDSTKDKPKYRPVFLTTNAITLSDQIQLIIRLFGTAEEIHKNYDFVHCTCVWDAAARTLTLPPAALESILAKNLQYMGGSKYPLCSIIRTRKFIHRGWNINAGQYVKMAWDLNKLDLMNPAVMEDQMIGVDAAYFQQVLDLLKEKGGKIEEAYLMEVIDRIF